MTIKMVRFLVEGSGDMAGLVNKAIDLSTPFAVEPLPDDNWYFYCKDEVKDRMADAIEWQHKEAKPYLRVDVAGLGFWQ